ncbi:Esterase-like activity of phytase [Paracoccus halophilus]|uniref:Alkaline phosphatase n=1 Tax=Paracoccus halophilus TaxID=376733 RepID=A0A099EZ05_9RHOB|nr:esterase-like activity of phytase family protein [Paracoccus halophilus]KGJ03203.1 alkaline phosphatase [Paracoccus halophilus]SFA52966.1 Esterase-like activity of phytase [Paracoccus halophilus]
MTFRLTAISALALAAATPAMAEPVFNRIASFPVAMNLPEGADPMTETSAEIMAVTEDGNTLIYSDSPNKALGFVDITDPRAPKPLGQVAMEGEPTTTVIIGGTGFVGVNTSESFTQPSGVLRSVDLASRQIVASCDLGGQPDSVARNADGTQIAVAIENERDEDVNDGAIPQQPAGFVVTLPVADGAVDCAGKQVIDLTGLADLAGDDPEPEYLSYNAAGDLVVTLQENNHLVVIGADGAVAADFPAGTVDLEGIDIEDDGKFDFSASQGAVPREPDAVAWLDDGNFVTANEGDWNGGSRSFTIWSRDGQVVHEDAGAFEKAIVPTGHYPDGRSDNKGAEPEAVITAEYDGQKLMFLAAERASLVGVYDVADPAAPKLLQLLPSGIGPEGLVAIPQRNLFATANETDLGEDGAARAHVTIFERSEGQANWPQIVADAGIGWGALSGLAVDAATPTTLYAVSDSVYGAAPAIFTIDASAMPAKITQKTIVTRDGNPAEKLDLEGIAVDPAGGFWLASEGDAEKEVPHAVLRVDANGAITQEIGLPDALKDQATRFGFEGAAVIDGKLWLAVQREWKDDPKGQVKLLQLDPASGEWAGVRYPLETGEGWVGLSDLAVHGEHLYLIERDNLLGQRARTKSVTRIALADLAPAPLGGDLPLVQKELVRDLMPDLTATGGFVLDKVEGLAITPEGTAYIATDNDGTDDSTGETMFFSFQLPG